MMRNQDKEIQQVIRQFTRGTHTNNNRKSGFVTCAMMGGRSIGETAGAQVRKVFKKEVRKGNVIRRTNS